MESQENIDKNKEANETNEKVDFSEAEIQKLVKKESKKKENKNEPKKAEKNEVKEATYLNLYLFKINIGLLFTYIYIFTAILLNVINRIIFYNYNFKFNFTFSFMQQLVNLFLFTFVGKYSQKFQEYAGIISFNNFYKYKYHYFLFSLIFSINILINFYANQLVKNISMFLSLRKFNAVMLFIVDFLIGKKKIDFVTILCIFLITGGSIIINSDIFYKDYLGYLVVFINNLTSISSSKYSEIFRKKTGDSNLKLLIYNAYIINPILFLLIFITGEYKKLIQYFFEINENNSQRNFIGLFFYLFLSCFFSVVLNSSFFISNEKISSLLTNLLTNSKSIFTSLFLYLFDKKKNQLTFKIAFGLGMSSIGAVYITSHSCWNKLKSNKKKDQIQKVKIEETTN